MTFIPLLLVSVAICCVSAQRFNDFDYQDAFDNSQQQQQQLQYQPPSAPARSAPRTKTTKATTPAPPPPPAILKQINTHNDDGSYTYGYEADDGSFKIETKTADGEIMGKYGYVDPDGKVRTVQYGANKYGFQPSGTGITVPPPTLVDESERRGPNGELLEDEEEDVPQQFRPRPAPRPAQPRQQIQPRPRPQAPSQPLFAPQPQQNYAPRPQPQQYVQPAPQQQQQQQPQYIEEPYVAPSVRPRQPSSAGPVPPRAIVPGAAVVAPPRQQVQGAYAAPPSAPVYEDQAPVFQAPRRKPSPRSSPSMLDDLAQQYALPSNPSARPVADFSFRSDDSAYSRTINF